MSDEGSYVGGLNITTNENINMSLTSNENATLQQLTADKCCHKGMEIPVKYTNESLYHKLDGKMRWVQFSYQQCTLK